MRKHIIVLVGLVLVTSAVIVAPATGQRAAGASMPDFMALARVCVNEAGWGCFRSGDGLAIHEVFLRGSARNGISYLEFAQRYSGRVLGVRPHNSSRLAWVTELNEDGAEPPHWPTETWRREGRRRISVPHQPWTEYRDRWLRVVARAREVMQSNQLSNVEGWTPCAQPVVHWGGPMDRARADRMGLREVECGETHNDFYQSALE